MKIFVTLFSGTVKPRTLKLGTHVDSGQLYRVYRNQTAPAFLSLYFFIFLSLQFSDIDRVATGQGNLIFLQGQGKVRKFCKLVREILNTKKVREKSENFIILAQNMCCSRYFDYLKGEKSVDFLKVLIAQSYENLLILEHSVPRNYLRILFVSFVKLGRCILVK